MSKPDEKADVWMPLYIGDYLADTTRLTTEQHGAYFLLLMDYWRNGPPPDEKIVLQNVTRLSDFLWKKHWPVLQKFFRLIDGHWHHKRLDEEIAKATAGKASATEKARAAANARWAKGDAPSNAQADAPDMLEDCPSSSPSPSPMDKPIGSVVVTGASNAIAREDDDHVPKDNAEWIRYFADRHGIEIDPANVHERKKAFPLFAAWTKAGITRRRMDAAIAKAQAEATESIAFLPAYVDRVIASMAAPRASPNPSWTDQNAQTIAALTGRNRSHEPDDRTIDI